MEFKITVPESEKLARVVAAFANSAGGTIFIGISDAGEINGVVDVPSETKAIERALHLIEPTIEVKIEKVVHDFRDVIAITVPELDFPDLCWVQYQEEPVLYFRIGAETRPIDRPSERALIRLRRRSRGECDLDEDAIFLLEALWKDGPKYEPQCAKLLNYSTNRARKLIEELIGGGFAIAYDLGTRRTYAAIRPAP